MAVRLLTKSRVVLQYSSNLRSVAQGLQAFSSGTKWGGSGRNTSGIKDDPITDIEATVWPDPYLGILAPNDRRLTLPGNIGLGQDINHQTISQPKITKKLVKEEDNILTCQLPCDRHRSIVNQAFNQEDMEESLEGTSGDMNAINVTLECIAQECPKLLQKDFSDLFPTMHLETGPFTVITMCQRTVNDMSSWSESVELERGELMLYFVIAAEEICSQLKAQGFWADFIDPSSGRPYLGDYTSATLFETDDRYRHFGFKIEDLGCCKVVSHRKWNTNVFVGCLFTNAPTSGPHIKSIIDRHNNLTPTEK